MGIKHIAAIGVVFVSVLACGTSPSPTNNTEGAAGEPNVAGHVHGAPPPPAKPLREGERFVEVGLQQAYQPKPPEGGTDEYRCFLVDPKLTEPAFVTGNQFLPQNQAIVHHAILYAIPASEVEHAKSVDAKADGDGWQCFSGTGLTQALERINGSEKETFIGAWAPGNDETLLGNPAGFPVKPGTQIVLQVHYNLLATNGKPGPTDQSTVRLRLMPGTAKVTPLNGALLPGPIELPCTAQESGPLCDRETAIQDLVKRTGSPARDEVIGLNYLCNKGKEPVPGPTQHCDHRIRSNSMLYAVAPHMHLLGRSIKVELNPDTPGARTLLDQPQYNFDDQSTHALPEPVALRTGDTIRVSCTHDASLRSQIPELKPLKPRYVVWGDGTSDEMCLALVTTASQ